MAQLIFSCILNKNDVDTHKKMAPELWCVTKATESIDRRLDARTSPKKFTTREQGTDLFLDFPKKSFQDPCLFGHAIV